MSSVLFYSTRKSGIFREKLIRKNYILKKNGPNGAPKRGHWRAKKGDTSEIVNIFVAVEGGHFEEKTIFQKKISQCRNTEKGAPLGF